MINQILSKYQGRHQKNSQLMSHFPLSLLNTFLVPWALLNELVPNPDVMHFRTIEPLTLKCIIVEPDGEENPSSGEGI